LGYYDVILFAKIVYLLLFILLPSSFSNLHLCILLSSTNFFLSCNHSQSNRTLATRTREVPIEIVLRYSLSVLLIQKIYSVCNVHYKFSILVMNWIAIRDVESRFLGLRAIPYYVYNMEIYNWFHPAFLYISCPHIRAESLYSPDPLLPIITISLFFIPALSELTLLFLNAKQRVDQVTVFTMIK